MPAVSAGQMFRLIYLLCGWFLKCVQQLSKASKVCETRDLVVSESGLLIIWELLTHLSLQAFTSVVFHYTLQVS